MPEALARIQQQAMEIWNAMDKSQKTRMIFIAIVVLASVSVAVFIITRPNYENLLNGKVDVKELTEIRKILQDGKIDFRMTDGGTGIQVRTKDREAAQMALADKGYPKDGTTFSDALSSIKLSTTESDKKKIFKEYTEQKIARGLKTIANINDAVVNLSIPESQYYLDDSKQQDVTAAVVIDANDDLTKSQITGIENFVAGSVEGLKKKNVMIIDKNTGDTLNDPGQDSDISVSTTKQYEFQTAKKKEVETQVKELLNMFDGIRVGANVVCDFNTETTKEVKYSPPIAGEDTGMLRSTQVNKEAVQNGSATGGTPGTDSNSGTPSYTTGTGSSNYDNTSTVQNFELNQKNTESTKAVGQMDTSKSSITVSLLYGDKIPNPPSQADISTYIKMISTATGIVNNNITIASFKLPVSKVETPKTDWMKLMNQIGPYALVGILLLMFAILMLKKSSNSSNDLMFKGLEMNPVLPVNIENEEDLPEIELEEKSEVKKQIDKFVKRKPAAVAQLLRNWLSDDWN